MSKRRKSSSTRNHINELTQALYLNGQVIQDGPKKKTWSRHDLRHIKPLTLMQEEMFQAFFAGKHILAHGSAGTGKTMVAIYLALNEYFNPDSEIERIVIVRTAVPSREIGFTPGTEAEKLAVYEQPYRDIFAELIGRYSTYDDMKEAKIIQFASTSFIRGITWSNSIVIFDEVQNANWAEISTVLTRVGEGTRVILCGDVKQSDLLYRKNDKTGITTLIDVVSKMSSFASVIFTQHDIVRSSFVKEFIVACEESGV